MEAHWFEYPFPISKCVKVRIVNDMEKKIAFWTMAENFSQNLGNILCAIGDFFYEAGTEMQIKFGHCKTNPKGEAGTFLKKEEKPKRETTGTVELLIPMYFNRHGGMM